MTESYLDKKFPDKIKDFHKFDEKYFSDILDQTSVSITRNMHPIIAYNFPNLLPKFFNENDLSNISGSPSIILNYEKNDLYKDKISESSFDLCRVIKKINNKEFMDEEITVVMSSINASKRQRSSYSKSYPILHDKFESVEDNFLYNMSLIAFEHRDYDFIEENIDYIKSRFKEKLVKEWWKSFFFLEPDQYTDIDLLEFVAHHELAQFAKSKDTIYKFWNYHNSTKFTVVTDLEMLDRAIEMNIDLDSISTDLLNENPFKVISKYPYLYSELGLTDAPVELQHLALKDPYNIRYIDLDESNVKLFLNYSNLNVVDAFYGLEMKGLTSFNNSRELLLKEADKFEGMFLALQAYPILMFMLDQNEYYKFITPYLINHSCKIDPGLFVYFKEMERKRWNGL